MESAPRSVARRKPLVVVCQQGNQRENCRSFGDTPTNRSVCQNRAPFKMVGWEKWLRGPSPGISGKKDPGLLSGKKARGRQRDAEARLAEPRTRGELIFPIKDLPWKKHGALLF